MVKKQRLSKKKSAGKKQPISKKKHPAKKKPGAKKKVIRRKKSRARGKQQTTYPIAARARRRILSGGQSGDTQGLSRKEEYDSESVAELAEEGQYFEAEAVSGVENAKDPDQGGVTTTEVAEDDVPAEYTDRDKP